MLEKAAVGVGVTEPGVTEPEGVGEAAGMAVVGVMVILRMRALYMSATMTLPLLSTATPEGK
jgi:hypothetical protein